MRCPRRRRACDGADDADVWSGSLMRLLPFALSSMLLASACGSGSTGRIGDVGTDAGLDAPVPDVVDEPDASTADAHDSMTTDLGERDVPPEVGADAVDASRCPEGRSECSGGCVDTRSDPTQCGGCGIACPGVIHARATCENGFCGFACATGYHRCGDVCADNDSPASCGAACSPCRAPPNATAACSGGTCRFTCEVGFGDCDGDAANGCESRLDTTAHCGTCERTCSLPPNASTTACSAGRCTLNCSEGFLDCNSDVGDGCEADARTSRAHCGACGNACASPSECWDGACATGPRQVVTGGYHTCALRVDGTVVCWGENQYGTLGDGTTTPRPAPTLVTGLRGVVELAAGVNHTCARLASGAVSCWGIDQLGQLGIGAAVRNMCGAFPCSSTAVPVPGVTDAVQLAAGVHHTCARSAAGGVTCWGYNQSGQSDGGGTTPMPVRVPTMIPGITGALEVSGGHQHTCVRRPGSVVCWGENGAGVLGDGTMLPRSGPVAVSGLDDAAAVSAANQFSCALRRGGAVSCWGINRWGAVGDGTTTDRNSPVAVADLPSDIVEVSAGDRYACARRRTGGVLCWGINERGQLGDGTTITRSRPSAVMGLSDAVGLARGIGLHACALRATGGVVCWGFNSAGQLGDGTVVERHAPVAVLGL